MTVESLRMAPAGKRLSLPRAIGLAGRELRGGIKAFAVFIACVALGVAAITAVGALADALRYGLASQGEALLGGDVTLSRPHQAASAQERAWMDARGRVSETATLRAMARRPDASEQALVEIKAIDTRYPLVGSLGLTGSSADRSALMSGQGIAVEPILLDRLQLKIGDELELGYIRLPVVATVTGEPDKITERLTVGPRVFMSLGALERTRLAEPGSLVKWRYAIKLPAQEGLDASRLGQFQDAVKADHPEAGFTVRDRRNPSPRVTQTLDRLRQFLTLVGLTALMVGGVGVANAVATYIDRRRRTIATFKSLGASSATIFAIHLIQVLAISTIGVALGLALGYAVPFAVRDIAGGALQMTLDVSPSWQTVLLAAAYGYLVALVFTLWPLGRAERIRASALFREEVAPEKVKPKAYVIAATLGAMGALVLLATLTSDARMLALYFCLAVAGTFVVFLVMSMGIAWTARRLPRPRRPEIALAMTNLGAPGGLTRSVVLSLGTGLSLLVAVAMTDASIVKELKSRLPKEAPNYFLLDIGKTELDPVRDVVTRMVPGAKISDAPMLRGRIVSFGGKSPEQIRAAPEASWVLRGDRGLTYAATIPEGSTIVDGEWWPADYSGPPLVSFEADIAKGLGLKVGDEVTVNVLGRNVSARIANLREVKWESLAINFVMVFSPNTLQGAPHKLLATVTLPPDAPIAKEAEIARALGKSFPSITAIRVKDAINAFGAIFNKAMVAVRSAGGVTLLAGALVLAGALATSQRRRLQQAVILKALGATRRRIIGAHMTEYLILACVAGIVATILGTAAAWTVVNFVMHLDFVFSWRALLQALTLAVALVMVFGGIGTWRILSARAVPHLRSE